MSLQRAFQLNLAWACLMALAFTCLTAFAPSIVRAAFTLASFAFVGISVLAMRHSRWAVVLVLLVAALLLIRHLPPVILNGWMYFTDHPLYLDSPATILIVAIHAVIFALPALGLVALYAYRWRDLRALLAPAD
jgi:hypothetical protein